MYGDAYKATGLPCVPDHGLFGVPDVGAEDGPGPKMLRALITTE